MFTGSFVVFSFLIVSSDFGLDPIRFLFFLLIIPGISISVGPHLFRRSVYTLLTLYYFALTPHPYLNTNPSPFSLTLTPDPNPNPNPNPNPYPNPNRYPKPNATPTPTLTQP